MMAKEVKGDEQVKFKGSRQEADKLRFDFFKHLTTLSTGSILLTLAMLEKLFRSPKGKVLVLFALICFAVCILGSLAGMYFKAYQVHIGDRLPEEARGKAANTSGVGILSFVLGIVFLIVFVGLNLLTL